MNVRLKKKVYIAYTILRACIRSVFSRHGWRYFFYVYKNPEVAAAYKKMSSSIHGDMSVLTLEQRGLLTRLLVHAYKTVPYYRGLFIAYDVTTDQGDLVFDRFHRIPRISDEIVRSRYHDLISPEVATSSLETFCVPSTTEVPLRFVQDKETGVSVKARSLALLNATGAAWGVRQLSISDTDESIPQAKVKFFLYNILFQSVSSPLVHLLGQYNPKVIWAHPKTLFRLVSSDTTLPHKRSHHRRAIVPAGTISLEAKRKLRTAGYDVIVESYELPLFGPVAYSCQWSEDLHVFPDFFVEIVSEDNQSVAVGETGTVLITSLHNMVMPYIRYDTGDQAQHLEYDTPCKCGFIGYRISALSQRASTAATTLPL